jgi:hypothetical protein
MSRFEHILHVLPDLVICHVLRGAESRIVQLSTEHEERLAMNNELTRSLRFPEMWDIHGGHDVLGQFDGRCVKRMKRMRMNEKNNEIEQTNGQMLSMAR